MSKDSWGEEDILPLLSIRVIGGLVMLACACSAFFMPLPETREAWTRLLARLRRSACIVATNSSHALAKPGEELPEPRREVSLRSAADGFFWCGLEPVTSLAASSIEWKSVLAWLKNFRGG